MCKRYGFALALFAVVAALTWTGQSAFAEPYKERVNEFYVTVGPDYTKTENILTGIGTITTYPQRILDHIDENGYEHYKDYHLTQNSTSIILETANSNSFVWNKNTCSYNLYHSGLINGGGAKVKDISWSVKGKEASAPNWSTLNAINNAACSTAVSETNGVVKVTGTKTNGQGSFQIELKFVPGEGIKETMRGYNNNILWNNHYIGFTEKFEVPQVIKFGAQTYDLSQYNGTVLGRTWIENNQAKLIQLTDKVMYDFGIGFDNLNDVTISYQNGKAYLSMNYLYTDDIVPYQQWVEVDPTLAPITGTWSRILTAASIGVTCSATASSNATTQNVPVLDDSTANTVCGRGFWIFNTAAVPDDAVVTSAIFNNTISLLSATTGNCDLMPMVANPFTLTLQQAYDDIASGTAYVSNSATCTTTGLKTYSLPAAALTDIENNLGVNRFSIGYKYTTETRQPGVELRITHTGGQLTITYTFAPPDAITTLHATAINANDVDIAWTAPGLNGGSLQVYELNYTSPCGIPLTALPNGTTATSYTVSGLTASTCYSIRVTAATQYGTNVTGANILNVTTLAFNQANFTIGSFNFDATNPLILPIRYERDDLNSTHTLVNVTFANTVNLACDLRYTYAGTNQTYFPMSSVVVSSSENESSFRFINYTNEITTFHCWDYGGNVSANYVLTQTDFLLLQQIDDFRNGTYGTMGQLGAFDFLTLIIIIIAMIGMNRTNEAVAGFFAIVAIAVLAFFEIIVWWNALVAGVAVVTMLAVASTRKD